MFGTNEIVGSKYFNNAGVGLEKLLVTSMFLTLQGEGPFAGRVAFFIRLAKCNLNCSFCDTYFDSGTWYSFEELEKKIYTTIDTFFAGDPPYWARKSSSSGARRMVLVITGGEPMLQTNLGRFLTSVQHQFEAIQIESNGILVSPIPYRTVLVVSPKCSEKKGKPIDYLKPNPMMLGRADCMKFVMSADPQSPYSKVPFWALEWRLNTGKQVYISPMNIYNREPEKARQLRAQKKDITIEERSTVDEVISFWEPGLLNMEQNKRNHEYAARYCIDHGLTLTLQMHLLASVA